MTKLLAAKDILAETKKIRQEADEANKVRLKNLAEGMWEQLPALIKDSVNRGHDFVLISKRDSEVLTEFVTIYRAELESQGYKLKYREWEDRNRDTIYNLSISWEEKE